MACAGVCCLSVGAWRGIATRRLPRATVSCGGVAVCLPAAAACTRRAGQAAPCARGFLRSRLLVSDRSRLHVRVAPVPGRPSAAAGLQGYTCRSAGGWLAVPLRSRVAASMNAWCLPLPPEASFAAGSRCCTAGLSCLLAEGRICALLLLLRAATWPAGLSLVLLKINMCSHPQDAYHSRGRRYTHVPRRHVHVHASRRSAKSSLRLDIVFGSSNRRQRSS